MRGAEETKGKLYISPEDIVSASTADKETAAATAPAKGAVSLVRDDE